MSRRKIKPEEIERVVAEHTAEVEARRRERELFRVERDRNLYEFVKHGRALEETGLNKGAVKANLRRYVQEGIERAVRKLPPRGG